MSDLRERTTTGRAASPRCVAIVGPYGSGKTTLLEALLERTGAIVKAGSVGAGTSVGDKSREARAHAMGVELNMAEATYLGDTYTFLDCPGSVEFAFDMEPVLAIADVAIVVCEPDEKKIPALQLTLKRLETARIPHILFLNKIDKANTTLRETLELMQAASTVPLVLRQIPVWRNGVATGTIDLALERALVFQEHGENEVLAIPDDQQAEEVAARYQMLEGLADYDDHLMEELLTDVAPPRDEICQDLAREMREGLIMPVFIGSAERSNGITRLLKALRHEAPTIADTCRRLGLKVSSNAVVQIAKTIYTSHAGKLSISRILTGQVQDGVMLCASDGKTGRISGVYGFGLKELVKLAEAPTGATVALGKIEPALTGSTLTAAKAGIAPLVQLEPPRPVLAIAVIPKDMRDDVKLFSALSRLAEEDPSLIVVQDAGMSETRLEGQGEMHLRVTLERLQARYGIATITHDPGVPYKETIRASTTVRGRHKKQSGGHGQFGDCVLAIEPLPRGGGFSFAETVTGGTVPRNYFGAIEEGVVESLVHGALGFPLVDLKVTLTDGSYHTVDSSDQAFKTAALLGMREGLPNCAPVLLEPVLKVRFFGPSDATARINQIVTGRRGQLLGFDARDGWSGWDVTEALIPQSEMGLLIVELRSATAGIGSFEASFDRLAEMNGQLMARVVEKRKKEAA